MNRKSERHADFGVSVSYTTTQDEGRWEKWLEEREAHRGGDRDRP